MDRETLDVLRVLNSYVERAQRSLAEYLPPDSGVAPEKAISGVLEQLDNKKLLRVQDEARKLVGKRPAFFTD